jgi:hypothetical protein
MVSLVLGIWFGAAVGLARLDVYRGISDAAPTIQYGILVPIALGSILIWRSAYVARLIEVVPQQWLVGVQLYRALGAVFLVLLASGSLPALFAWPAGAGDIAIGLTAPIVAFFYARNAAASSGTVMNWNILGLGDLIVAVATGFLTSPSPLQLFAFDAPNELISVFPLVLIPVFLVPLSVLLHIASLVKLRRSIPASSYASCLEGAP